MSNASPKPRLGIARCLLGEAVRHDGTHALDRYLRDTLGPFVEWVPVCPEVECGMPVPREATRLVGDPVRPALVGRQSGADWTGRLTHWGRERLADLARLDLHGWIFRSGSPACGPSRVRIRTGHGAHRRSRVGLWAGLVGEALPRLPCEDDERLRDPAVREHFITRIFTLHRWRATMTRPTPGELVDFHTRHKLLVMAHSVERYRALGRVVALAGTAPLAKLRATYLSGLLQALAVPATPQKHANVLQHAAGYFRKHLDADDKAELGNLIEQVRTGLVPLLAPVTLLNHYAHKHGTDYLARQVYLHPYPAELLLRNHV